MRRIALIMITLSILFFIGGFIAVKSGRLDKETFNESATIIGGIISILGLLAFVLPGIKASDIKNIEIENLKKLAETAEQIQLREKELDSKQNDLEALDLKKKEMEFLIRKASLSLYLKDQLESYNKRLEELLEENREFSKIIKRISDLKKQSQELDIEINKSPLADQAFELILSMKQNKVQNSSIELGIIGFMRKFAKSFFDQLTK